MEVVNFLLTLFYKKKTELSVFPELGIVNGTCQLSPKVFMLCSYSGDKLTLLYIF